jgi:hypothetical protein
MLKLTWQDRKEAPNRISLFDLSGKRLSTFEIKPVDGTSTINIGTLKPGMYISKWQNPAADSLKIVIPQ